MMYNMDPKNVKFTLCFGYMFTFGLVQVQPFEEGRNSNILVLQQQFRGSV